MSIMLLTELDSQEHTRQSVSRYRIAADSYPDLTPHLLDLSDKLLTCVTSGNVDRLAYQIDQIMDLPLPDTLTEFRESDQQENAIACRLLTCLTHAIQEDRCVEIQTLNQLDTLLRTLVLDRHGYASVAPPGSATEQTILTGLRFALASPDQHIYRCQSVTRRYQQSRVSDHRTIGNLCYEARAIGKAIPLHPQSPDESRALTAAAKMFLVMGVDGASGRSVIEMFSGITQLADLFEQAPLPKRPNTIIASLCDGADKLSPEQPFIDLRVPLSRTHEDADIDYRTHLTQLEAQYLSDKEITRLLAERMNVNTHAALHRNPTRPSDLEKLYAMTTLTEHLNISGTDSTSAQKVHVIYDHDGEIGRLATQDDEAWMAVSEGYTVETSIPITEVVDQLVYHDWTAFAGESWKLLGAGVEVYLDHLKAQGQVADNISPMFNDSPVTLPPILAQDRLDVINTHGSLADLPIKRALTEIVVAAREGRKANDDFLCSNDRVSNSWETIEALSFDATLTKHISLDAELQQLKASGHQDTETVKARALLEQRLRELNHHMDDLGETESEQPSLG